MCKYAVTIRRIFLHIPHPCRYDTLASTFCRAESKRSCALGRPLYPVIERNKNHKSLPALPVSHYSFHRLMPPFRVDGHVYFCADDH